LGVVLHGHPWLGPLGQEHEIMSSKSIGQRGYEIVCTGNRYGKTAIGQGNIPPAWESLDPATREHWETLCAGILHQTEVNRVAALMKREGIRFKD